jgi:hypothetical protein
VSGRGMSVHSGSIARVRGIEEPSNSGMVVMGTVGVTTLHSQEMGKPELPLH